MIRTFSVHLRCLLQYMSSAMYTCSQHCISPYPKRAVEVEMLLQIYARPEGSGEKIFMIIRTLSKERLLDYSTR